MNAALFFAGVNAVVFCPYPCVALTPVQLLLNPPLWWTGKGLLVSLHLDVSLQARWPDFREHCSCLTGLEGPIATSQTLSWLTLLAWIFYFWTHQQAKECDGFLTLVLLPRTLSAWGYILDKGAESLCCQWLTTTTKKSKNAQVGKQARNSSLAAVSCRPRATCLYGSNY